MKSGKSPNNRIYSKELLELVVYDTELPLLGYLGTENNLHNVAFTVEELKIKDGNLYGRVSIIDNHNGRLLKDIVKETSFVSCGYGTVSSDGVVGNYTLTHVSYVQSPPVGSV